MAKYDHNGVLFHVGIVTIAIDSITLPVGIHNTTPSIEYCLFMTSVCIHGNLLLDVCSLSLTHAQLQGTKISFHMFRIVS